MRISLLGQIFVVSTKVWYWSRQCQAYLAHLLQVREGQPVVKSQVVQKEAEVSLNVEHQLVCDGGNHLVIPAKVLLAIVQEVWVD